MSSGGLITTPSDTVPNDMAVSGYITCSYQVTLASNTMKRMNLANTPIISFKAQGFHEAQM